MGFFALHDFTERKYVNGVRCCCVYACKLMSDIDSSHTIIGISVRARQKYNRKIFRCLYRPAKLINCH